MSPKLTGMILLSLLLIMVLLLMLDGLFLHPSSEEADGPEADPVSDRTRFSADEPVSEFSYVPNVKAPPEREPVVPADTADQDSRRPPGRVYFNVISALDGEVIDPVNLRFMNEDRFADYGGSGSDYVLLSEGIYTCAVTAPGFEPLRLADVRVRAWKNTDLGTLVMRGGGALIEGTVQVAPADAEIPIEVELYGAGRRPCDLCRAFHKPGCDEPEKPCPCGYGKEKTTLQILGDQSFRFPSLAGGTYYIRARAVGSRYFDEKKVVLDAQGYAWTSLSVARDRALSFYLIREEGRPFLPVDRKACEEEVLALEEFEDCFDLYIDFTFKREGRLIAYGLAEPVLSGEVFDEIIMHDDEIMMFGAISGEPRGIDRARNPQDLLIPSYSKPLFNPIELIVKRHNNNHWTLSPLPTMRLETEVSYCDFRSDSFVLDLAQWGEAVVTVEMKNRK
jgi:hypothetical protein